MKYPKNNSKLIDYFLNKSTSMMKRSPLPSAIAIAGMSALIGLPVLSQSFPPMVFFQPLSYPNQPQRAPKPVDLIASLENDPLFENLLVEVKAAGLTQELKQGQFTLLAPNNNAFDALSDKAYDKFSDPVNSRKILQYHLIPGKVTEEDIQSGTLTNLVGEEILVTSREDALKLNEAKATFPSIAATNGVVIEIDQVLLPPGLE